MALSVYKVDKKVRLVLGDTAWSRSVLNELARMGHEVDLTGEDGDLVFATRPDEEVEAATVLIDSTGH